MSKYIKKFNELTKKDTAIAGGKGASLGEMTKVGIPVPPGFVVSACAFEKFLEESDLGVKIEAILQKVKPNDINSVEKASEKIRDLIRDEKFPKDIAEEIEEEYKKLSKPHPSPPRFAESKRIIGKEKGILVAVRSSATAEDSLIASWAGELESYLNVNQKNLLESVKKCWSSLFTPRAIFYRFEKKMYDQKVSVAVVIQKMIQSEVSGICFTVHPVTEDRNQMVIEAGWGLGEAIVGGMITPDTYVINKKKGIIEDKNISDQNIMISKDENKTKKVKVSYKIKDKQKLTDKNILELARLCTSIEKHYEKPQDIEWAMEKNKIYIVQSRPITTL